MAKTESKRDVETPPVEAESSSKFGWLAMLAVLSIVGLVAWFIFNGSDEA